MSLIDTKITLNGKHYKVVSVDINSTINEPERLNLECEEFGLNDFICNRENENMKHTEVCLKCRHFHEINCVELFCNKCVGYSKFIPYIGPNNIKTEEKKEMEVAIKKNYTTYAVHQVMRKKMGLYLPEIKDVIFNPPATIVFWEDGTKTVVKCENEAFDPEKGLAMAISKKALGNKYEYFNHFKRWTKKYYKTHGKFVAKNPPQVEFTMTGCSIDKEELGELLGTTKDGKKFYINPVPKDDEI